MEAPQRPGGYGPGAAANIHARRVNARGRSSGTTATAFAARGARASRRLAPDGRHAVRGRRGQDHPAGGRAADRTSRVGRCDRLSDLKQRVAGGTAIVVARHGRALDAGMNPGWGIAAPATETCLRGSSASYDQRAGCAPSTFMEVAVGWVTGRFGAFLFGARRRRNSVSQIHPLIVMSLGMSG